MLCFRHIFSLLARVDYIGDVNKLTGKAKLRFYIKDIEKSVIHHLFQTQK
jgi:hypothetical protein